MHRDIKCDNIFINSNKGEIRIGDLGSSRRSTGEFRKTLVGIIELGCSFQIFSLFSGTPEFMAPEIYEEKYGPLVDIYSFGMTILEIVTGQTPYQECISHNQIFKKCSNGIKPDCLNLILNENVKNFILKCLEKEDKRPSALDLLNDPYAFLPYFVCYQSCLKVPTNHSLKK